MNSATEPWITPCSSTSGTAVTMPQLPSQRLTMRSLTTKPSPLMIVAEPRAIGDFDDVRHRRRRRR